MADVYRNMLVPDAFVALARGLSAGISPVGGAQMYETGLSPTGAAPATHWISSGYIAPEYAELMPLYEWVDGARSTLDPGQAELVAQYATESGVPVTVEQVQALYDAADITTEEPFAAMTRLGLQIVQPEDV